MGRRVVRKDGENAVRNQDSCRFGSKKRHSRTSLCRTQNAYSLLCRPAISLRGNCPEGFPDMRIIAFCQKELPEAGGLCAHGLKYGDVIQQALIHEKVLELFLHIRVSAGAIAACRVSNILRFSARRLSGIVRRLKESALLR